MGGIFFTITSTVKTMFNLKLGSVRTVVVGFTNIGSFI